jgi:lysophospholipase L1-like esterase
MMKKYLFAIFISQLFISVSLAQTKPHFWDDVQTIKKYDQMYAPPVHPVLFVGSSSIRKWDDLQRVFADYKALNRGVGGTVINDIIFYLNDIVFNYQPSQIVLYVGENDLIDATETADTVLNRTIVLFNKIREKLPEVPIVYIAMKPSPSRDKFAEKAVAANGLIKQFLAKQKNTAFVDVYPLMLSNDGKSRPELFVGDMLHMNKQGYAIWEKAVRPYLIKNEK